MKIMNKYIMSIAFLAPIILLSINSASNQVHAQQVNNPYQVQKVSYFDLLSNSAKNRRQNNLLRRTSSKPQTYKVNRYKQHRIHKHVSEETQLRNRINTFSKYRTQYHYPKINWNARDLGGYRTYHGYYVAPNRIIRGGNLHYISNRGIKQMHQHHINKVIDLRSVNWHSGVRKLSDPGESYNRSRGIRVRYYVYPTNTDAQKAYNQRYTKHYGEIYNYGRPFVTYKTARRSYYNVFKTLLNNKHGATYFHCLEGHDRTGTTSALILAALGVKKSTIYNDFLLTEKYQRKYPYTEQIKELNHFYSTINHNYGNIIKYLHKGVGLSSHQIKELRKMYLVKKLPKGFVAYR